jgi:solute carrier family 13 (sodium-dependent dicarboxylate transporter), member 2/3/5
MAKVLLIDDEHNFRESMAERLKMRGYENITLPDGRDALKTVRSDHDIDVVLLDRKMPGPSGEQVLKDIKKYRPEIQVIILTGFGSTESAVEAGKLDAFSYMQKPVEIERLIEEIEKAREAKIRAMDKYEIPDVEKGSFKKWFWGTHNSRPGLIIIGFLLFAIIIFIPTPDRMNELLDSPKEGEITDINNGYSDYKYMEKGENLREYYSRKYKLGDEIVSEEGKKVMQPLSLDESAFRAKVMIGVLVVAVIFWASGALPIGFTAICVGVFMYFLGVLKPNDIAQAYFKDSVVFVFGVLAFSTAITKTGLDRRIGLLLLGSSRSQKLFLFVFLPLFAMACSFLSEHALIAFIMPVLLIVYLTSIEELGVKDDFKFAVMLFLAVNFSANVGGPGSPAAGGRNAIMLGILQDYGSAPTFGQWVQYGLPFVPVMALVIGTYFYFACYRKSQVRNVNIAKIVRKASDKIGPMTTKEYITSAILVMLIVLWVTTSDIFGMGGPVILALVLLNIFRIISWRNIAKIQWEVVALYAAATAMGKGLAVTGAALYLADAFVSILPPIMQTGEGLAIAASIFTGAATNFMSDGAAVSAIGPITVPIATIAGASAWQVGLTTAFASSFAHMLVIGTPNNAIVFTMAKNPVTGAQLVKLSDFAKHGFAVFILSMIVLWFWVILGYWQWMEFLN